MIEELQTSTLLLLLLLLLSAIKDHRSLSWWIIEHLSALKQNKRHKHVLVWLGGKGTGELSAPLRPKRRDELVIHERCRECLVWDVFEQDRRKLPTVTLQWQCYWHQSAATCDQFVIMPLPQKEIERLEWNGSLGLALNQSQDSPSVLLSFI